MYITFTCIIEKEITSTKWNQMSYTLDEMWIVHA